MSTTRIDQIPGGFRALRLFLVTALLAPLLAACAGSFDASRSTQFDSASDKAIVVVGTSVTRAQEREVRAGRSLETYWQEYDPDRQRLTPGGKTFLTKLGTTAFSAPEYTTPTVSVLEIDPGHYALVGAGFPHLMTLFVQSNDPLSGYRNQGRLQAWTYTVDPRRHIDPEAEVDPRENVLFSVEPGQIVYIGHLRFVKPPYIDRLVSISYSQDLSAAREALKAYPGIVGGIVPLDLTVKTETAAR